MWADGTIRRERSNGNKADKCNYVIGHSKEKSTSPAGCPKKGHKQIYVLSYGFTSGLNVK